MHKSELLLPAGSLVKLKTAILYGADAVYAGTPDMCLRAQSKFSLEELEEGIEFVHKHSKKIYLTLNLFMQQPRCCKRRSLSTLCARRIRTALLIADPAFSCMFGTCAGTQPVRLHASQHLFGTGGKILAGAGGKTLRSRPRSNFRRNERNS